MLRTLLLLLVLLPAASAQTGLPLPTALDAKVETLLAPLSAVPRIQRAQELLWVETTPASASGSGAAAWVTPSFGTLRPRIAIGMPVTVQRSVASQLWPGRTVDRFEYRLPADLLPDLYDLEVAVKPGAALSGAQGGNDQQRRAVAIVKSHPAAPRVVVLADTHVHDVRTVQDGATDAVTRNEINQAVVLAQRSVGGDPTTAERWAATARVIREINLARPDFVLVTGDLTFLTHPTAAPYEMEDAWQLFDKLEVPSFIVPGNHDLYAVDESHGSAPPDTPLAIDGRELWQQYFGPLYFSTEIGPALHLAGLNTFEWPRADPFPADEEFDTRAAGHVQQPQFDWLQQDLAGYRRTHPKGTIVSFAHHDPSFAQRRHAWTGERRLELRDLLAAHRVGVHFSGHTHEDRVARYLKGDVVQTNGRPDHDDQPVRTLHLLTRDGIVAADGPSQAALAAVLHAPTHGPLFVSTTTAASQLIGDIWGLGGYWGWRLATLADRDGQGGLDPADFGYPVTDDYLAARAERPEHWTAEHARHGVFSVPSYELDYAFASGSDAESPYSDVTVTSRLLAPLQIGPLLTLPAADGQFIETLGGAGIRSLRYGEGRADVRIEALMPAMATRSFRIRHSKAATVLLPEPPPASSAVTAAPSAPPGQIAPASPSAPTTLAATGSGRFGGALPLSLLLMLGLLTGFRRARRMGATRATG